MYYNLIVNYLGSGSNKRTGKPLNFEFITIHNTGNPESTVFNERTWLDNPSNKSQVAWHYCIQETDIIQAVPINEVCYHAGSDSGNFKSIGIEVCESGNHDVSVRTCARLVADLLFQKGYNSSKVKPHSHWTKTECPRLIKKDWNGFIALIDKFLLELKNKGTNNNDLGGVEVSNKTSNFKVPDSVITWAKHNSISDCTRLEEPATRGEMLIMLKRLEDSILKRLGF